MQHHKYSLTEIENMIPWERDIYVNMLIQYLEEEKVREQAARRGLPDPELEVDQITRSRRYDAVSETLRKTFLAMGEDIRVVLIKLADRLHNMRTLVHLSESKRKRIAQQTMDIFAPLANRLGIWQMKWELEDLAFRHLYPDTYKEIAENLDSRRADRERELKLMIRNFLMKSNYLLPEDAQAIRKHTKA